jgi:hypothetical protein
LMFAWVPYALPRLQDEETKSRLERFSAWAKGLFQRRQKSA